MESGELVASIKLDASEFEDGASKASKALDSLKSAASAADSIISGLGTAAAVGFGAFGEVAGTAIGAIASIGEELTGFAKDAAFLPTIRESFDRIASGAGKAGETMLKELTDASGGMISAKDAMTNFNQAAMLISPTIATELPKAMEYLQKVSMSTGTSMEYLMNSLVVGVGRASPRILDNMGVQIKATEAYDAYASSIGKSAKELTKQEQSVAIWNMTLQKLEENTSKIPSVQDSAAASIQRFQATLENVKNEMGVAFLPTVQKFLDVFTKALGVLTPVAVAFSNSFGNFFQTILKLLEPAVPLLEKFAGVITNVSDAFLKGNWKDASRLMSEGISTLAEGLTPILKDLAKFGTNIIFGLVQGVGNAIPSVLESLSQLVVEMLPMLETLIPEALKIGLQMILSLAQGIADALPRMMPSIIQIMKDITVILVEMLPQLLEVGVQIIMMLIEGINEYLPTLIGILPDLIHSIINVILESLPLLVEAGIGLLGAITQGLVEAIPELLIIFVGLFDDLVLAIIKSIPAFVTAILDLAARMAETFSTLLPKLLGFGKDAPTKFATGVRSNWDQLTTVGGDMLRKLWDGIVSWFANFKSNAKQIVSKVMEGIKETIPNLPTVGADMLKAIWDGIKNTWNNFGMSIRSLFGGVIGKIKEAIGNVWNIGKDLVEGIWEGIKSKWTTFWTNVRNFFKGIVDGIKGILGIHSPSKVFADIGANMNKGLLIGLNKTSLLPEKAFQKELASLGRDIQFDFNNFESVVPEYKQNNYNLTMPTTANPTDVGMAFELMRALGA